MSYARSAVAEPLEYRNPATPGVRRIWNLKWLQWVSLALVGSTRRGAAVARGCNVDKPRNLAKSVTVE